MKGELTESNDHDDWIMSQLKRTRVVGRQREALRDRDQAEAAVYERLASIVESSDDAIISKDLNGIVLTWNKGAEHIFGYTVDEMIGQPIARLIPSERHDEEPAILERLRRGERVDHYETVRIHKDGKRIDISLTVSPLRDANGRIVGASKIARDITERKAAERALQMVQSQLAAANAGLETRVSERTTSLQETVEQLEEFSYSVSHDLRAPLRAMLGYAVSSETTARSSMSRHGNTWTASFAAAPHGPADPRYLDLQSPQSPRDPPAAGFARWARARDRPGVFAIDARHHLDPEAAAERHRPRALPDASLSNILDNAVKFVPPGTTPRVRIWAEQRGSNTRLWIGDNGIGIKPEHKARLFGMFERVHPDKHFEGTGIGLAIVRKAVERMGGQAGVESDGLSGSDFWIELPAAPAR